MILNQNKIFFFSDYSNEIGFGHFSRSKLLAEKLAKNKFNVKLVNLSKNKFILTDFTYKLKESVLSKNNISNLKILQFLNLHKVKLVIFDNYIIDNILINELENFNIKTISILSSPKQISNSGLSFNFSPYNDLKKNNKKKNYLGGLKYVLFSDQFLKYKNYKFNFKKINLISVILGGSINNDYFELIIDKLVVNFSDIKFNFFFFKENFSSNYINNYIKKNKIKNINIIINSNKIAYSLYSSDLVITSGGYSSFECCFLEKPFLTIQISELQKYNCESFQKFGSSINLGDIKNNKKNIYLIFKKLINNERLLKQMIKNNKKLFKNWKSENIINSILKYIK